MTIIGYAAFSGLLYYPQGGIEDYNGTYTTPEEARTALAQGPFMKDWWHIVAIHSDDRLTEEDWGHEEDLAEGGE